MFYFADRASHADALKTTHRIESTSAVNPYNHHPTKHHHPSLVRVIGLNFVEPPRADDFLSRRDRCDGGEVVDLVLDKVRYFLVFLCLPESSFQQLARSVKVPGTILGFFSPSERVWSCMLVVA